MNIQIGGIQVKKILLIILIIIILGLLYLIVGNEIIARKCDKPSDSIDLNIDDKSEISEVMRVKSKIGNEIWPEFGDIDIPIILFNDRFEFIFNSSNFENSWKLIEDNDEIINKYYRRDAMDSKAFAVNLGEQWAGSIGTLERMNKEYFLGVRSQLPPIINKLFPYQLATLTRDFHVVVILHEVFHAYQATVATDKFVSAESVYRVEKLYPYNDKEFIDNWNKEGEILSKALNSKGEIETKEYIAEFLQFRNQRRKNHGLSKDLIDFERKLEWLEGLAKYVEIKSYELAKDKMKNSSNIKYREGLPYWRMEFQRIKSRLGEKSSDYRFYLSGMAQARLLDIIGLDWKNEVMKDGVFLEDLLEDCM